MKKLLAMLLSLVMVFSLCACGNEEATETKKEGEATKPTEEMLNDGPTRLTATITFGHNLTDAQVESINHRLQPFYARFPGVQVIFKYMDGPITAENAPTIFICDPDEVPAYVKAGLLMDMNQWIDAKQWVMYNGSSEMHDFGLNEDTKEDMDKLFVEEGKQFGNDATYLLPFSGNILVMYFNATIFDENDLDSPPSMSWEELLESCRKLKEIDPDSVPLAINRVDEVFLTLCVQQGVEFNADNWQAVFGKEGKRIAKELNEMYQKGYLTTAGLQGTALDLVDRADRARNYIVVDSSTNAWDMVPALDNEAYEYETDAMTMSRLAGESPKVLSRSKGIAICKTEDEDLATAAWLLAKFMSVEASFQGGLAKDTATIPTTQSAWMEEEFGQYLNEGNGGSGLAALVSLMAQDQDSYRFTVAAFENSAEIRDRITTLIEQCLTFTGDVDAQIEEAFETALAELNQ